MTKKIEKKIEIEEVKDLYYIPRSLNALERSELMKLLPTEGSYPLLRSVREKREQTAWSDEEYKKIVKKPGDFYFDDRGTKLQVQAGTFAYNFGAVPEVAIDLGEVITDIVIKGLTDLEKTGKLKDAQFTLYEKYVLCDKKT